MIAIVDYGAGNLHSVQNAFDCIGVRSEVVTSPADWGRFSGLVLPGVGHFGPMMAQLEETGLRGAILEFAASGKPLLGICLGMQALHECSEEAPGISGLGLIRGVVRRYEGRIRVPHIGWNWVDFEDRAGGWFYFANTYRAEVSRSTWGKATYSGPFAAAVREGNVTGVQFHPEKSSQAGLELLREWSKSAG